MITVAEYMTPRPVTIDCRQSVAEATEAMRAASVRHLAVLDGARLIGILSERDVYRIEATKAVDPEVLSVGQAMTPEPITVAPNASVAGVARVMAARDIGSVLVVDDDVLVGVFTASDGLRALADTVARRAEPTVGAW